MMGNMMTDGVMGSPHNKNKIKQDKQETSRRWEAWQGFFRSAFN